MGFRSLIILSIAIFFPLQGWSNPNCAKVDDSVFTLYVYGDSDARTLMTQRCLEAGAKADQERSPANSENMECHCYDRALNSLLNLVSRNEGPIQLITKKLSTNLQAPTCQEALQKCEIACQESAKTLPKPCADLKYGGITLN